MSARPWCAIGTAVAAAFAAAATAAPARAEEDVHSKDVHPSHASHPPLDRAALAARLANGVPRVRAARARVDVAAAEVAVVGVRPNPGLGWEREAVPGRHASDDFVRVTVPLEVGGRRGLRDRKSVV